MEAFSNEWNWWNYSAEYKTDWADPSFILIFDLQFMKLSRGYDWSCYGSIILLEILAPALGEIPGTKHLFVITIRLLVQTLLYSIGNTCNVVGLTMFVAWKFNFRQRILELYQPFEKLIVGMNEKISLILVLKLVCTGAPKLQLTIFNSFDEFLKICKLWIFEFY